MLVAYLALLVGLGFALYAVGASAAVKLRLKVVVGLVVAQACVGLVQFWTHVPAALVTIHVALAGACTAATAALYAAGRVRVPVDARTDAEAAPPSERRHPPTTKAGTLHRRISAFSVCQRSLRALGKRV